MISGEELKGEIEGTPVVMEKVYPKRGSIVAGEVDMRNIFQRIGTPHAGRININSSMG